MIRVYFNLHKHLFSIQQKINGRWKVVYYADTVYLQDVIFKVSQAGRERVIREKKKNVHAYVLGTEMPRLEYLAHITTCPQGFTDKKLIRYNPYVSGNFFKADTNEAVNSAGCVKMFVDHTAAKPVGRIYGWNLNA